MIKKASPKPKNKTFTTSFDDFDQLKIPNCPQCSSSKHIIKVGKRKVQNEMVQDYLCKNCNKKFVDRTIKQSSYHTPLILHALTYFNLGHTLAQTQATMKRKYKAKIPISTLNNWASRFEDELTFIRLRKKFDIDPFIINLPEGHLRGT